MKNTPTQRTTRTKPSPPGRNGFKYRPRFGVVVLCKDERHQARVYAALLKRGYTLRVVAV